MSCLGLFPTEEAFTYAVHLCNCKPCAIFPDVLRLLQMVDYNEPSNACRLTPAHPVSVMDVDDRAHKVTSSLPLVPEDIQSSPSMFLIKDEVSHVISSQQKNKRHFYC